MLELSWILVSVVKQLTSESLKKVWFLCLSTVKPLCLQPYEISLTQRQIRLVKLGLPSVQSFFFFFSHVEILSEWQKGTLFANTIAYHGPAVDHEDSSLSMSPVHCRPCRACVSMALLETLGRCTGVWRTPGMLKVSQLCIQTMKVKSWQAEMAGCSVTYSETTFLSRALLVKPIFQGSQYKFISVVQCLEYFIGFQCS